MTVECPKCGTKATFNESKFAGQSKVSGRCPKCKSKFTVDLPAPEAPTKGVPAPWAIEPSDSGTRVSQVRSDLHLPENKVVALSIIGGPCKGQLFRLSSPRVVMGRQNCDLVLDDPEISRQHCVVEVCGLKATLTDLNTTNGTFVEGQRVKAHELHHLAEFRIGGSTVMYTVTEPVHE